MAWRLGSTQARPVLSQPAVGQGVPRRTGEGVNREWGGKGLQPAAE